MSKINIGDVVMLKSGGPKMTVSNYPFMDICGNENENVAECNWFEGDRLVHGTFKVETLMVTDL